ncbi:MAG: hypothetical protein L6R43_12710 [Planctomycetes bacterium]|nr:hypothetical protein [Planctomycetota bacterium]
MNRMWMGLTLVAVGISGCCAGLEFGAEARVPPWSVHAVVLFCALLVPAGAGLLALHARGAPKERPVRGGARNLPAGGDPAPEEWDYELPLPVLSRLDAIAGRLPTEDLEGLRVMLRDGLLPLLPSRLGWGCTRCGIDAPRRKVTLTRNTGMLVLRRHETLEGEFCGPCLRSLAGDVALHNLALGWWGSSRPSSTSPPCRRPSSNGRPRSP